MNFQTCSLEHYNSTVVRLLESVGARRIVINSKQVRDKWILPHYPGYIHTACNIYASTHGEPLVGLSEKLYTFYWNLESRERHGMEQLKYTAPISYAVNPYETEQDELSSFKLLKRHDG